MGSYLKEEIMVKMQASLWEPCEVEVNQARYVQVGGTEVPNASWKRLGQPLA